ncbi:MAG: eCIS core domain-containing protein [Candidatus Promineifilaceae bacterium]
MSQQSSNQSANDNSRSSRAPRSNKANEGRIRVREYVQRQPTHDDGGRERVSSRFGDVTSTLQRQSDLRVADRTRLRPTNTLGGFSGSIIQPKMEVNTPNDQYEVEADRVADQVMRMPTGDMSAWGRTAPTPPKLQLKCAACGGDDETAMRSSDVATPEVTPTIERNIQKMQGGGQPLDDNTRGFFEQRMGADFSSVRVHTDSNAIQTSRDINARAFTTGNNIAFNSGEYNPNSSAGKHLLAHELTHTIQQGASSSVQREENELTSEQQKALQIVADFENDGESSQSFPQILKADIAAGLRKRIKDPRLINQNPENLCGPAAFGHVFATDDVVGYTNLILELYKNGSATLGENNVSTRKGFKEQKVPSKMDPVDWVLLGGLRDDENSILQYDAGDEVAGITTPGEMEDWLKGVYEIVEEDAGTWATEDVDHLKEIDKKHQEGYRCILLVNWGGIVSSNSKKSEKKRLKSDKDKQSKAQLLFPTHYITYKGNLTTSDTKVEFDFWHWGRTSLDKMNTTPESVDAYYYGAVCAKDPKSKSEDNATNTLQRQVNLRPQDYQPVANHTILRPANTIGGLSGSIIQPTMQVDAPNNQYEVEADRVADQVIRMPTDDMSAWGRQASTSSKLQLKYIAYSENIKEKHLISRQLAQREEMTDSIASKEGAGGNNKGGLGFKNVITQEILVPNAIRLPLLEQISETTGEPIESIQTSIPKSVRMQTPVEFNYDLLPPKLQLQFFEQELKFETFWLGATIEYINYRNKTINTSVGIDQDKISSKLGWDNGNFTANFNLMQGDLALGVLADYELDGGKFKSKLDMRHRAHQFSLGGGYDPESEQAEFNASYQNAQLNNLRANASVTNNGTFTGRVELGGKRIPDLRTSGMRGQDAINNLEFPDKIPSNKSEAEAILSNNKEQIKNIKEFVSDVKTVFDLSTKPQQYNWNIYLEFNIQDSNNWNVGLGGRYNF